MKLKHGLVLRTVGGQQVLASLSPAPGDFGGMILLNSTAACLCAQLQRETDRPALIAALTERFAVSEEQAAQSVDRFVARMEREGLLEP